jgi:hypothetical protein
MACCSPTQQTETLQGKATIFCTDVRSRAATATSIEFYSGLTVASALSKNTGEWRRGINREASW